MANKYSIVTPAGLKQHLWCLHLLTGPRSPGVLSDSLTDCFMPSNRTEGCTSIMRMCVCLCVWVSVIRPQRVCNIQQNILQNLNCSLNFNGAKGWFCLQIPSEILPVDHTLQHQHQIGLQRCGSVGAADWKTVFDWNRKCKCKRDKSADAQVHQL